MNDLQSQLPWRFERLIERLFYLQGFEVINQGSDLENQISEPDFVVRTSITSAIVEVKFYRSFRPSQGSIARASIEVEKWRAASNSNFAILATMSRVDPAEKADLLLRHERLRIYDYDVISMLCGSSSRLAREFDDIAREAFSFSPTPLPEGQTVELSDLGLEFEPQSSPEVPQKILGAEICRDMRAVPPTVSRAYEEVCFRAIEYLFNEDIVGLVQKTQSDTGMHEYDAVGKISSRQDFWNALISDYRSRYIIFEFKNYKDEANQTPIYTTEKYLFPTAMRGTAIIIARNGFGVGAMKAIRGALRESGKLILPLSENDVCTMLHAKDANEDYLAILIEKLDAMLISLER